MGTTHEQLVAGVRKLLLVLPIPADDEVERAAYLRAFSQASQDHRFVSALGFHLLHAMGTTRLLREYGVEASYTDALRQAWRNALLQADMTPEIDKLIDKYGRKSQPPRKGRNEVALCEECGREDCMASTGVVTAGGIFALPDPTSAVIAASCVMTELCIRRLEKEQCLSHE